MSTNKKFTKSELMAIAEQMSKQMEIRLNKAYEKYEKLYEKEHKLIIKRNRPHMELVEQAVDQLKAGLIAVGAELDIKVDIRYIHPRTGIGYMGSYDRTREILNRLIIAQMEVPDLTSLMKAVTAQLEKDWKLI